MIDLEQLRAIIEAAPDWDHQVDLRLHARFGDAANTTWIAEVEALGSPTDEQADALAKLLGALDRATLLELVARAGNDRRDLASVNGVTPMIHALRERAAVLVEDADDIAPEDAGALNALAAAIRALPLPGPQPEEVR